MQHPDPKTSMSGSSQGRPLALRFISGKYQGGEFPLIPGKEIQIGRSNDLEMVLAEDMVSRRHAKITFEGEEIFIEDVASTNGTFVNGEKIKRSRLREGDRVLIGTSILKVVVSESPRRAAEDARRDMEATAHQRSNQGRSMSGSIEEIPLPDLLQLLGTSKKNGVLVIRTEGDVGKVHLQKGIVHYATINHLEELTPLKAMFRMLSWTTGMFDLEPPEDQPFPNPIDMSVQGILMEGLRQMDELNEIKNKLPKLTDRLHLDVPLTPALRALTPDELDVVQLIHNFGYFEQVLNRSVLSDLDTAVIVEKLMKGEYVRAD